MQLFGFFVNNKYITM